MLKGTRCIFLMFDVARRESFDNLINFLTKCQTYARKDVLIYLIGNTGEVTEERGVAF